MNIALIGYGKMGKAIEEIALHRDHHITAIIEENNWHDLESLDVGTVDVAIEFSQPEAAYHNIHKCLQLGIRTISGTTGWLDRQHAIERFCKQQDGTFFYASNFSMGVNIFFKINEVLAEMMDKFPDYHVQMEETHHIHKKDSPSGTAITLAQGIATNHRAIKGWIATDGATKANKEQLPIKSIRENEAPGTHTVQYTSHADTVTITHKAHSREGFASGAVLVAEWIVHKKGILSMKDFLQL